MTQLKSLAHPDWPYAGTAHEWRGFVKDETKTFVPVGFKLTNPERLAEEFARPDGIIMARRLTPDERQPIYQIQNFGPDLD